MQPFEKPWVQNYKGKKTSTAGKFMVSHTKQGILSCYSVQWYQKELHVNFVAHG